MNESKQKGRGVPVKKAITLFGALLLCMTFFCGCDLNLKPRTLEESQEIPADGMISAEVFETLKKENKVITFTGTSGGVRYEWTVFGSDITAPKDTDLRIEILEEREDSISFRICSEADFGFTPVLSIHASNVWNGSGAVVCENGNGGGKKICSASVTGSKNSVLNFSVTTHGSFTVMAEHPSDSGGKDHPSEVRADGEDKADEEPPKTAEVDPYISQPDDTGGRKLSDGKQEGQDQYKTDPVPEGKPMPAEPENQQINKKKSYTCTFSIECSSIFNNLESLEEEKLDVLPPDGVIFHETTVTFYEGESVYDVLQRVCKENGIQMDASWTPMYNSAYVEGICNLYEFDCGSGSGWMYRVNGWYPNYGCSRYRLAEGETVEWRYTCDLGADIGGGYAVNP